MTGMESLFASCRRWWLRRSLERELGQWFIGLLSEAAQTKKQEGEE